MQQFKYFVVVVGFCVTSYAFSQSLNAETRSGDVATDSIGANAQPNLRSGITSGNDINLVGRSSANENIISPAGSGRLRSDAPLPKEIKKPNDFQQFVADSTGKNLPLFGADFFANVPSTFAPIKNTPVPSDYLLGAGDEVLIKGWGSIDINVRAVVDRSGIISIPTVGNISLVGVKAADAEGVIHREVDKLYKGVNISVSLGQLRAITVYVVGQASRPGSYTVSSFSTLVTALFASGGPNLNGSLRKIQVKRNGKTVGELDLYAFIAKGDKSADVRLQDGDTIYIPSAIGYVAVSGTINSPAVYELRSANDSLGSILELAGGVSVVADPRRVFLERIDSSKSQPRTVEEFALDGDAAKKILRSGDVLTVSAITPNFSNAVTLRGNVNQPLRAAFVSGMRISDLIPSKDFLITRAAVLKQNGTVLEHDANADALSLRNNPDRRPENEKQANEKLRVLSAEIGNSLDDINWNYASIERLNRETLSVKLITFNLADALNNPQGKENIALQAGDIVTIFSQNDIRLPLEKRKIFVRVEGEVHAPGIYQMSQNESLVDLIARAGGTTDNAYLFGTQFYRDEVRKQQEANLEKISKKLEERLRAEQLRSASNVRVTSAGDAQLAELKKQAELQTGQGALERIKGLKPTGRIAFSLDPSDTAFSKLPSLKLENGDQLVIPSTPDFVHVFGAVNQESSFLWQKGATVGKFLDRAGPTTDADLENTFVLRADGSVLGASSGSFFSGINGIRLMPGDSIVVPDKLDKETAFTKFTAGMKDWAQIFSGFGLGAAAIKTLK